MEPTKELQVLQIVENYLKSLNVDFKTERNMWKKLYKAFFLPVDDTDINKMKLLIEEKLSELYKSWFLNLKDTLLLEYNDIKTERDNKDFKWYFVLLFNYLKN